MTKKLRRLACVGLTVVMGASLATSHALALANGRNKLESGVTNVNFENVTGTIDLSSIVLNNLSPSVLENAGLSSVDLSKTAEYTVIVELDEKSVLEVTEDNISASDYLSTYAGRNTLSNIRNSQTALLNSLKSAGIKYSFKRSYTTVMNAVALTVNYSSLKKLNKIPGVKNVVLSSSYEYPKAVEVQDTAIATNYSNIYGTGIYNSEDVIDEYGVDGSGVAVAILDTGLDYTHEAFTTYMPETVRYTKNDIAQKINDAKSFKAEERPGTTVTADDVYVSKKVPFAYDYADDDSDVYPSYSNHGTHVAGIVAGHADSYKNKDGYVEKDEEGNEIPFKGVAPNAQLVICKVFTDDFSSQDLGGAVTEDILAALDDCVNLGVDVINMSLGSSAGFSSISIDNAEVGLNDTEGHKMNEVYQRIKDAGISLICAASNDFSSGFGSAFGTNLASNPDSGVIGSPSTFTGAMSVASINGQYARYMTVDVKGVETPIYYQESSDENSVSYDFLSEMLEKYGNGGKTIKAKYVTVRGNAEAADYTSTVQRLLKDKSEGPVIAVIKRGKTTFQDKVRLAMEMGADAVILANNVAGTIRMSLGDIKDPIPSVSITMDAGNILESAATGSVGYIYINADNQAGPFMNDYSSWGTTSDLKLKPDITAHGGEITSSVPGGYNEQSGTSMASPNFAGFVALLRSYLAKELPDLTGSPQELTRLVNQITMSTAVMVNDQELLPYSPRKQGAGLATLANVFTTKAYLSTVEGKEFGTEDNRPKVELGDDKEKKGEYTFSLYVNNFGNAPVSFALDYKFMTETRSGLSVAEKAHLLTDNDARWTVNGQTAKTGDTITVPANTTGETYKVTVTVSLSSAEKKYIDDNFVNGMFVEGFIILTSRTEGQCDLSLPYMGFYGDWKAAPMLDYDCFEISAFQQDTSMTDEERPQAQVWATQAYAEYYNRKYSVPLGGFMYTQNERADQIYTTEDYSAISCYNEFVDAESNQNYLTTTSVKALYAGLLRSAEVVSYQLSDAVTGEILVKDYKYRVSKAYANGGSAVPANVELNIRPDELGLVNNGKYRLDFAFYFDHEDVGKEIAEENTFTMSFYVDYEAPVLESAKIRYYDYKDNNKDKQRIYLDLAVYDNHYAQSVILCYADQKDDGDIELVLATEYVTPVLNAVKNGTSTVSIEITDIYEKYKNSLYIQLDDYALNHSVYRLAVDGTSSLPNSFEIKEGSEITISVNESRKLNLVYEGDANISDFTWNSEFSDFVKVKNGEIFGVEPTGNDPVAVTVSNGKGLTRTIMVTVKNESVTLPRPSISFGLIETAGEGLKNAAGAVKVYAGKTYKLEIVADPWYYPVSELKINWKTNNDKIASVTPDNENGTTATVVTHGEEGSATITAVIVENGSETLYATTVTLNVQDPFTVQNFILTDYKGPGGTVIIPNDENIMYIGEEAFKDDKTIERVIIPKTVMEIRERAFAGCTNLKEIYFINAPDIDVEGAPAYVEDINEVIPDSNLSVISMNAFRGCTSLEYVDLTNVKVATLVYGAFQGCTSLKEIKKMTALGAVNDYAFLGCTSLKEADITGLHTAGAYVFAGCTNLTSVITGEYSDIGEAMFSGCIRLTEVTINTSKVGARAFAGCESLSRVTFGVDDITLGDQAFYGCNSLRNITLPSGEVRLGDQTFPAGITITGSENGAVYEGTKLLIAPSTITADFAIKDGTTEISAYAFAGSVLADGVRTIEIPASVTAVGEGAFAHLMIENITLPSTLTEIPAYLMYGCSKLKSITIPAGVKIIGEGAFEGCIALAEITDFENNTGLVEIASNAFTKCEALTAVTLPSNVKVMGDEVFAGCTNLTEVHFPAITSLGENTFGMSMQGGSVSSCSKLHTVTFADEATTIGTSTFFPGFVYNYGLLASALKNVTLPAGITEIPEGTFYYCSVLETINLKNVTKVGAYAFANCTSLKTIEGLDKLTDIGNFAFANCFALTSLNLTSAVNVGSYAFDMSDNRGSYTTLTLTKAENIGNYAFFGGKERTVTLPATLKTLGYGVFTGSPNLTAVNISNSELFKSEDGVLYRNVKNAFTGKTYTELMVYPAAKSGETYTVPEGTISIAAYAFAGLGDSLKAVTLPYSLKTVGASAFLESGIVQYTFTSYEAPVLLSENLIEEVTGEGLVSELQTYFTLYYRNFENSFVNYSTIAANPLNSTLQIVYPKNGTGYDNYVFARYFGLKTAGAEVMEEDTNAFKSAMDDLVAQYGEDIATKVSGWTTSNTDKAAVESFSDTIKDAHRLYNNIKTQSQITILNEGKEGNYYYNLLASVESALKPVKEAFGIAVKVESIELSPDSNYRTEYKEGEAFDKSGMLIIVTYDDYSTQIITADQIKVTSDYAESLTELDKYVMIEYEGSTLRVPVNVTAGGVDPDKNPTGLIVGCVCGGVALLAIVGAVVAVLLIRKKKAAAVTEAKPLPEEESTIAQAEPDETRDAGKEEDENKDEN